MFRLMAISRTARGISLPSDLSNPWSSFNYDAKLHRMSTSCGKAELQAPWAAKLSQLSRILSTACQWRLLNSNALEDFMINYNPISFLCPDFAGFSASIDNLNSVRQLA